MRALGAVLGLLVIASCSSAAAGAASRPTPATPPIARTTTSQTPIPAPTLPAYYIDSLRARQPVAGKIEVLDLMFRQQGFAKYHVTWVWRHQANHSSTSSLVCSGAHRSTNHRGKTRRHASISIDRVRLARTAVNTSRARDRTLPLGSESEAIASSLSKVAPAGLSPCIGPDAICCISSSGVIRVRYPE
jgi:hypothetical protein